MSASLAMFDSIQWNDFSPVTAEALRKAEVKRVELIKSQAKWVVYVTLPEIVPRQELDKLAHNFCSLVQGITSVEIVPDYKEWGRSLDALFHSYWETILSELTQSIPALATARFSVEETTLNIHAANEVSLQYLQAKGASNLVKRYLRETFGVEANVKLEIDPGAARTEDIICQAQEVEQKLLAKIRREETAPPRQPGKTAVVFGRAFTVEAVPLKEIQDEERSVIVQGQVFGLEMSCTLPADLDPGEIVSSIAQIEGVSQVTIED